MLIGIRRHSSTVAAILLACLSLGETPFLLAATPPDAAPAAKKSSRIARPLPDPDPSRPPQNDSGDLAAAGGTGLTPAPREIQVDPGGQGPTSRIEDTAEQAPVSARRGARATGAGPGPSVGGSVSGARKRRRSFQRTPDPEPPNEVTPAISLGETVSAEITAAGETDSYPIPVPAGTTVFFDALSSGNTNGLNWRIANRYGRTVLSHTTAFQDGGPVPLVGGDYTISVFGESGTQTGTYSFRVVDASPETAAISVGGTASGEIDVPGDSDVYTFTAAPGQIVFLDRLATSNNAGLNWRLEDSFGRRVLDTTGDLSDQGRFRLVGGNYTLRVQSEISSGQGQIGTYQFQLVGVTDGVSAINVGDLVSDAIDQTGQEDRFSFNVAAGRRIFLDRIATSNSAGLNWYLDEEGGRRILARTGSLDDIGAFPLMGGRYILTILGEVSGGAAQTGTYQFRIVDVTDDELAIAIGDLVPGDVTIGQEDRYTFSAAANQEILLDRTAASNSGGLNWSIEDAFGRTVLARTASLDDVGPIRLVGGSYVLTVVGETSGGVSQTGTYTFRVTDVADDASVIAVGASPSGSIDLGEEDTYNFSAPTGQIVRLVFVSSSNSGGLNWSLEDSYGRVILARTASLSTQGPFTLVGGSYTIRILGELSGGAAQTGTYSFTLENTGSDTSFVPSGTPILLDQLVDTQIAVPGSPDLYLLTVPAGEKVYFDLLLGTTNLRWTLLDPVGRAVFGPTQANNVTTQNQGPFVLAAGDYTLRVEDIGGATPAYRFRAWDVQDVASSLSVGGSAAATLATPGAVHTYSFTVAGGTRTFVDNLLGASNLTWSLFDPAGTAMVSNASMGSASNDLGPFTLAAGTYSLVLDASNDAVPSYSFALVGVGDTSSTIAVDDVVNDSLATPGAVNSYTIPIADGQRIYADVQTAASSLVWSMIDPEGHPFFLDQSAGSASIDQGPVTLSAGDYEIRVRSTNAGTSSYQFRIWNVQDQTNGATLGVQVAGTFTDPGAAHRFDVAIAANGDAAFFDNQLAASNLEWTLTDPVGQAVFSDVSMNSASSADRGPYTLTSGTYRLQLGANGGALPSYQFTPWGSTHPVDSLAFDTPVVGDLAIAGSTHAYTFTALEGQKLLFDLTADTTNLRWTLFDPHGVATGLIDNATANDADTEDKGPLFLEAGSYRLVLDGDTTATPHYEFIVHDLAHDLEISDFTLEPAVLADGDTGREVTASWTVRNNGGLEIVDSWVDRIYLSLDATYGNGDDVLLGEFAQGAPLASLGSRTRSEVLQISDTLALGSYLLFLVVDAADDIAETLGEDDNVADHPLLVAVAGLPEPGLETIESFASIAFTATQGPNSTRNFDFPLATVVDLTDVRFVSADATRWEFSGPSTPVTLSLWLMDGTTEVVRVGQNRFTGNLSIPTEVVARLARDLTPAEIATLPSSTIDGIRFKIETTSGNGTNTSRVLSTHADGKLRVHFVTCEFAPCGPHRKAEFQDLTGVNWTSSQGTTPWQEYDLPQPVPVHGLRYISGGPWVWTWSIFDGGPPQASVELQVILNDGSSLTLDDWISPSTGTRPPEQLIPSGHSLMLDPETQQEIDGLWILGFRWRVHACCTLGFSVYPGCPSSVSLCAPAPSPLRLFFLYDFGECRGAPSLSAVELEPLSGSSFAAGSRVVITGVVPAPDPTVPIAAVLVDGQPVDSIDASGRFFKTVDVAVGDNVYEIEVVQPGCGQSFTDLHLTGVDPETSGFVNLADVSNQISATYRNTTFHRTANLLVMDVTACNTGDTSILGPLQMVITRITDPAVTMARPEGATSDGKPYVVISDFGGSDRLDPGECAAPKKLAFHTPQQMPVRFDVQWRSPLDGAPYFVTAPPTRAAVGEPYAYGSDAEDPDGDTLAYALVQGPAGMTLHPSTGLLTWTPAPGDLGSHMVVLRASDGFGGVATQRFTLEVGDGSTNSPPYFTSSPTTQAAVGARYRYQAAANDADGDAITFTLADGPAGAGVDPGTGLLTWDFALPGSHPVEIEASDGAGIAIQRFVLTVGSPAANPTIPQLFGSPASVASIGRLYVYQPVVDNPDAGETVVFDLPIAPVGMSVDPVTGRVGWTPTPGQEGPHDVLLVVDDGNGGSSSQQWTIEVFTTLPNRPPYIESVPPLFAVVGQPYEYPAHATDPEGGTVTYSLVAPQPGMLIEPATGLLTWSPPGLGSFTVAVRATDAQGDFGAQVYTLDVLPPNQPPTIVSPLPTQHAQVGGVYQHDVDATDPESGELRYRLQQAPPGMTIHGQTGLVSWRPHQAQVGTHPVVVVVQDEFFASDSQSFNVVVDADLLAPVVNLRLSALQVAIGAQAQACVEAADDVGLVSRTLLVDGSPVAIDLLGCFILTYEDPRTVQLRAEAVDGGGNVGFDEATLAVVDPSNGTRPEIETSSIVPPPESVITQPTPIYATITDDTPQFLTWEVRIARVGTEDFRTIATGSGEVQNGVVATLDPTLLANDVWRVQIVGNDGIQTGGVEFRYSISGENKLGDFQMMFTDLVLPVAGIPIVVTRQYDSLDTTSGDFGLGWRLGLPGKVADGEPELPEDDPMAFLLNTPFTLNTRVYVTRPDGRRVGFKFAPRAVGGFTPFQLVAAFEADSGVTDTLEAVSPTGSTRMWAIGGRFYEFVIPYNPTTYILTTKERVKYTIHEVDGLQSIEDSNGNTLTVTPGGLVSSTGVSLTFLRDGAGRITKVIEPDDPADSDPPGELDYVYDGLGRLTGFRDQLDHLTEYFYEEPTQPTYVTRIEDPLNRSVVRNVFDASGRLLAQCEPGGNVTTLEGCLQFSLDPNASFQTVINARGFRVDLFLDARGNTTLERHWLDGMNYLDTVRTYDADDNLLTLTDAAQNTWTYTYDDRGNRLTRTDPEGRTWTTSYGTCDKPTLECDPLGSCTASEYDDSCNLTVVTDALGNVTSHEYNEYGQKSATVDAVGNLTEVHYDPATGFPSSMTDPGGTLTVEFAPNGEIRHLIDRNGRRTDFVFDDAHRNTAQIWNTVPPRTLTIGYDAAGRTSNLVDPDSSIAFTYGPTGQVETINTTGTPGAPAVGMTYAYDGNGNLTQVSDSLGGVTDYQYDPLDRLMRILQHGTGVDDKRLDIEHDPSGAVTMFRRWADLAGTVSAGTTTFDHDCAACSQSVTSILHEAPGGGTIAALDYVRDAIGNILQATDTEGVHLYAYDGLRRLLSTDHPAGVQPDESYSYDAVGNRLSSHLSAAYQYGYQSGGAGNRLVQDDDFGYLYDPHGSLVRRTDLATGGRLEFDYDHRNRVVALRERASDLSLVREVKYRYDALNRRIMSEEGGTRTWFAYDGSNPALKLRNDGTIASRRMYDRTIDGIQADEVAGATRWFLTDAVGTVRDLVDDGGQVLNHYVFDSFGRLLSQSNPTVENDLLFAGRETDGPTGLMHLRARMYSPGLGRFLSIDPRDPFRYEYAENNPLVFTDPSGESLFLEYVCVLAFSLPAVGTFVTELGNFIAFIAVSAATTNQAAPGTLPAILVQTLTAIAAVMVAGGKAISAIGKAAWWACERGTRPPRP